MLASTYLFCWFSIATKGAHTQEHLSSAEGGGKPYEYITILDTPSTTLPAPLDIANLPNLPQLV